MACVMTLVMTGCSTQLPPCPRIITAMPDDTRSMMVVRVPLRHSQQESECYDEGGLKAVDDLHGLLASNGGDGVAWSLWARDNADWVGVAMRDRITDRGEENLNIKGSGMVAFRLSSTPLPSEEAFPKHAAVVGQVGNVMICYVERSTDYPGSSESPSPGAYFAVVDQQLFIASLDRVDVEECVRRARSTSPQVPSPLRTIAHAIPDEATSYMLRTPYNEEGGRVNLVMFPATPIKPREVSSCFIPDNNLEYRIAVQDADASAIAGIGGSFIKPNETGDSALTHEESSQAGFRVCRIRVDLRKALESRRYEGLYVGMGMAAWCTASLIGLTNADYDAMREREQSREAEEQRAP